VDFVVNDFGAQFNIRDIGMGGIAGIKIEFQLIRGKE